VPASLQQSSNISFPFSSQTYLDDILMVLSLDSLFLAMKSLMYISSICSSTTPNKVFSPSENSNLLPSVSDNVLSQLQTNVEKSQSPVHESFPEIISLSEELSLSSNLSHYNTPFTPEYVNYFTSFDHLLFLCSFAPFIHILSLLSLCFTSSNKFDFNICSDFFKTSSLSSRKSISASLFSNPSLFFTEIVFFLHFIGRSSFLLPFFSLNNNSLKYFGFPHLFSLIIHCLSSISLPSSYRIWTENGLFSPQCLYIFY
jgi:hypothetical protein